MNSRKATRIDGATLSELKDAVRELRAIFPDSALADLVDARIAAIEERRNRRRSESSA